MNNRIVFFVLINLFLFSCRPDKKENEKSNQDWGKNIQLILIVR